MENILKEFIEKGGGKYINWTANDPNKSLLEKLIDKEKLELKNKIWKAIEESERKVKELRKDFKEENGNKKPK